jgi:hypothetical protein
LRFELVLGEVLLLVFKGEVVREVEGPDGWMLVWEELEVNDLSWRAMIGNVRGNGQKRGWVKRGWRLEGRFRLGV